MSTLRPALKLWQRNMIAIARLPSALAPSIVFPVFSTIAFASVFGAAIKQYYPDIHELNWYVPFNALQGAAFGGVFGSFGAIRDFQTGVMDRLLAAPMSRRTLLVTVMLTALARTAFPVVIVLAIGALGGMTLPGGVMAVVLLTVACAGIGVAGSLWGAGLAYRFKTMAAAPLMQVGVFVLVFLAPTQVPMEGLSGWLHAIARVNPATNVLRMARQGFLHDVTWHDTWPGLVALVAMIVLLYAFAARAVRRLVP